MIRNHFLFTVTSDIVERLIPMGIIQHSFDINNWIINRPYESSHVKELVIVTLRDLDFAFLIWIFSCCLSICGFLIEFLLFRIEKLVDNMIIRFLIVRDIYSRLRM